MILYGGANLEVMVILMVIVTRSTFLSKMVMIGLNQKQMDVQKNFGFICCTKLSMKIEAVEK